MKNKKIFFICPTNPQPSGGVKQIYRMVDILNENGFDAAVLHKKPKQRESWFPNSTKIVHNRYIFKLIKYLDKKKLSYTEKIKLRYLKNNSFQFESDSILVFPEIYSHIQQIEPQLKKVIFNQNCYYTFNSFPSGFNDDENPYKDKAVQAIIVVSEDSKNYIKKAFGGENVYRIRLGINNEIFTFSDNKEKRIAYMPRKLSEDTIQIVNIFNARNPHSNWSFSAIDNKTELEVAEILKTSAIFLSFNHREGFGLPPVEAMSCGCYVIGYQGQAGKEYLKPEFSSPVNEGEILEFVLEIERITGIYDSNPDEILLKSKAASDFVLQNYNTTNEQIDVVGIWNKILSQ